MEYETDFRSAKSALMLEKEELEKKVEDLKRQYATGGDVPAEEQPVKSKIQIFETHQSNPISAKTRRLETESRALKLSLEERERQVSDLQSSLVSKEDECVYLGKTVNETSAELRELNKKYAKDLLVAAEISENYKKASESMEVFKNIATKAESELRSATLERNDVVRESQKAAEERNRSRLNFLAEQGTSNANREEARRALNVAEASISELEERTRDLENDLAEKTKELENVAGAMGDMTSIIGELEVANKTQQVVLQENDAAINVLKDKNQALIEKLAVAEEEKGRLYNTLTEIRSKKDSIEQELARMSILKAETEASHRSEMDSHRATRNAASRDHEARLYNIQDRLKLEANKTELEIALSKSREMIEMAKREQDWSLSDTDKETRRVAEETGKLVAEMQAELNARGQEIRRSADENKSKEERIQQLTDVVAGLESSIQASRIERETAKSEHDMLVARYKDDLAAREQEIKRSADENRSQEERIQQLTNLVAGLESSIQALRMEKDDILADPKDTRAKRRSAVNESGKLAKFADTDRTRRPLVNGELESAKTNLKNAERKLDELTRAMNKKSANFSELSSRLKDAENDRNRARGPELNVKLEAAKRIHNSEMEKMALQLSAAIEDAQASGQEVARLQEKNDANAGGKEERYARLEGEMEHLRGKEERIRAEIKDAFSRHYGYKDDDIRHEEIVRDITTATDAALRDMNGSIKTEEEVREELVALGSRMREENERHKRSLAQRQAEEPGLGQGYFEEVANAKSSELRGVLDEIKALEYKMESEAGDNQALAAALRDAEEKLQLMEMEMASLQAKVNSKTDDDPASLKKQIQNVNEIHRRNVAKIQESANRASLAEEEALKLRNTAQKESRDYAAKVTKLEERLQAASKNRESLLENIRKSETLFATNRTALQDEIRKASQKITELQASGPDSMNYGHKNSEYVRELERYKGETLQKIKEFDALEKKVKGTRETRDRINSERLESLRQGKSKGVGSNEALKALDNEIERLSSRLAASSSLSNAEWIDTVTSYSTSEMSYVQSRMEAMRTMLRSVLKTMGIMQSSVNANNIMKRQRDAAVERASQLEARLQHVVSGTASSVSTAVGRPSYQEPERPVASYNDPGIPIDLSAPPLTLDADAFGMAATNMALGLGQATIFWQEKDSDVNAILDVAVGAVNEALTGGINRVIIASKSEEKIESDVMKRMRHNDKNISVKDIQQAFVDCNNVRFIGFDRLAALLKNRKGDLIESTTFILVGDGPANLGQLVSRSADKVTSKLVWSLPKNSKAVREALEAGRSFNENMSE